MQKKDLVVGEDYVTAPQWLWTERAQRANSHSTFFTRVTLLSTDAVSPRWDRQATNLVRQQDGYHERRMSSRDLRMRWSDWEVERDQILANLAVAKEQQNKDDQLYGEQVASVLAKLNLSELPDVFRYLSRTRERALFELIEMAYQNGATS
jgi:hypothetical protein